MPISQTWVYIWYNSYLHLHYRKPWFIDPGPMTKKKFFFEFSPDQKHDAFGLHLMLLVYMIIYHMITLRIKINLILKSVKKKKTPCNTCIVSNILEILARLGLCIELQRRS